MPSITYPFDRLNLMSRFYGGAPLAGSVGIYDCKTYHPQNSRHIQSRCCIRVSAAGLFCRFEKLCECSLSDLPSEGHGVWYGQTNQDDRKLTGQARLAIWPHLAVMRQNKPRRPYQMRCHPSMSCALPVLRPA